MWTERQHQRRPEVCRCRPGDRPTGHCVGEAGRVTARSMKLNLRRTDLCSKTTLWWRVTVDGTYKPSSVSEVKAAASWYPPHHHLRPVPAAPVSKASPISATYFSCTNTGTFVHFLKRCVFWGTFVPRWHGLAWIGDSGCKASGSPGPHASSCLSSPLPTSPRPSPPRTVSLLTYREAGEAGS